MTKEKSYIVEGERKILSNEQWDFLIILDACRYDCFADIYEEYLGEFENKKLKKAISPAFNTMDWLNKVFTGYYEDIIYISANPYINSKVQTKDQEGNTYFGKEHFFNIIDVWDWGWAKKLGTTHPEAMHQSVKQLDRFEGKRVIIHYIQPHEPYIGNKYLKYLSQEYVTKRSNNKNHDKTILSKKLNRFIRKISTRYLGAEVIWKLCKKLKKPITNQAAIIYYNEGFDGVKEAYMENLELVLYYLTDTIKNNLYGRILITSDHGEYLGESRKYGHTYVPQGYPVSEVPWLEITRAIKPRLKSKKKIVR